MKDRLLKQAKPRLWLGGFQVQVSMASSYYLIYVNLSFMALMFWHTTAAPWLRQFHPGAEFWMFVIFMGLLFSLVMLFDRKVGLPSRQAYQNQQAYKHANPAVDDLQEIKKKVAEIPGINARLDKVMKKLGIEEGKR